jgi:ZIP family zinc transporter
MFMSRALSLTSWRHGFGTVIAVGGMALLARELLQALSALPAPARSALTGGLLAAGATAGTLPVPLVRKLSPRHYDAALGLGGGVKLAATTFSLSLPALAVSKK